MPDGLAPETLLLILDKISESVKELVAEMRAQRGSDQSAWVEIRRLVSDVDESVNVLERRISDGVTPVAKDVGALLVHVQAAVDAAARLEKFAHDHDALEQVISTRLAVVLEKLEHAVSDDKRKARAEGGGLERGVGAVVVAVVKSRVFQTALAVGLAALLGVIGGRASCGTPETTAPATTEHRADGGVQETR